MRIAVPVLAVLKWGVGRGWGSRGRGERGKRGIGGDIGS